LNADSESQHVIADAKLRRSPAARQQRVPEARDRADATVSEADHVNTGAESQGTFTFDGSGIDLSGAVGPIDGDAVDARYSVAE